MIQIGDKLVSEDLRDKQFVCDLHACKGACCVEGDAGAPITKEEAVILDQIFENVAPYLTERGRLSLAQYGRWVREGDDYETPLLDGKECAYTVFDEDGTAKCGIELAWKDGAVSFQKPVSCHLYPVRINRLRAMELDAVNYERWHICDPACSLGAKLKVPVYVFLKDALVRKYGQAFYDELDSVFKAMDESGY